MKSWIGSIAIATLTLSLACAGDDAQETNTAADAEVADAAETADAAEATEAEDATPGACLSGSSNTIVFSTSLGDITLELFPEEAPITVENFIDYVESCFYDGTVFHRVVPGFVIQGGGMTADMQPKATRDPITNEADNGLLNERGTLSMARRPSVNSATSQFFINLVDNTVLDHGVRDFGYAVFARVTSGMEVVDQIAARGGQSGDPVLVTSARRQ